MQTFAQFIESAGLKMTSKPTATHPGAESFPGSDHYRCTITSTKHRGRMALHFSKGSGHHGEPPTLAEVLECLASDAAGAQNARDFSDWCSEYGYDDDSRRAHSIFRAVERQRASLLALLGTSAYDELLYHVRDDQPNAVGGAS